MMKGDVLEGDVLPSLSQLCFPRVGCCFFVTWVSLAQVVYFGLSLYVGAKYFDGAFVKGNDMLGPSPATLEFMGAVSEQNIITGQLWKLGACVLVQKGLIQLALAAWVQLRVGYVLELRWGSPAFACIFSLAGIGGALFALANTAPDTQTVGATGAMFGLLGGAAAYLSRNWDSVPDHLSEACFLFLGLAMAFMLAGGGASSDWARVGGLLSGGCWTLALVPARAPRPDDKAVRLGAAVLGALFYLGLALLVVAFPQLLSPIPPAAPAATLTPPAP